MNGYLMLERTIVRGDYSFLESNAQENSFGVVFEDNGETGYFYAVRTNPDSGKIEILDALHIYEVPEDLTPAQQIRIVILWSRDWLKSALVLDGLCHALFDFEHQGGYNINEFPPPNQIWTKNERKLTDTIIRQLF